MLEHFTYPGHKASGAASLTVGGLLWALEVAIWYNTTRERENTTREWFGQSVPVSLVLYPRTFTSLGPGP